MLASVGWLTISELWKLPIKLKVLPKKRVSTTVMPLFPTTRAGITLILLNSNLIKLKTLLTRKYFYFKDRLQQVKSLSYKHRHLLNVFLVF